MSNYEYENSVAREIGYEYYDLYGGSADFSGEFAGMPTYLDFYKELAARLGYEVEDDGGELCDIAYEAWNERAREDLVWRARHFLPQLKDAFDIAINLIYEIADFDGDYDSSMAKDAGLLVSEIERFVNE